MRRCVLLMLVWLLAVPAAQAADRVALVLANGAYTQAPALPNAQKDGQAVAESLRRLGFTVFEGVDLDLAGTRELVKDFAYGIEGAELALFYYAGHGLQVGGENYIVPVDAQLEKELDLAFQAMPLTQITSVIERRDRTAILILDACRDNPFVPRISRSLSRSRSTGQGLAEISAGLGTLVVFATDPGKVAFDGRGDNSPFTTALVRHMESPGLEIRQVMTRVRRDVLEATDGAQRPWDNSSLLSDVYLVPAAANGSGGPASAETAAAVVASLPTTAVTSPTDEQRYWDGVQQIGDPDRKVRALEMYLAEFPDGRFASLARLQLDEARSLASRPPAQVATLPPAEGASQARVLSPSTGVAPPQQPAAPPEAAAELAERVLDLDAAGRRRIQTQLNRVGHPVGAPDGAFGPRTRSAIAAFQKAQGLDTTGFLDTATVSRLADEAAKVAAVRPAEPAPTRDRTPPAEVERTARPPAVEPSSGTLVACRGPNDPSWVDYRLISLADCKRIGGRWTVP